MIIDVLMRFELEPADNDYQTPPNEQLQDLRTYLEVKMHDASLQSNSTRLKINSFIMSAVTK